jgi:hypothetical protein
MGFPVYYEAMPGRYGFFGMILWHRGVTLEWVNLGYLLVTLYAENQPGVRVQPRETLS